MKNVHKYLGIFSLITLFSTACTVVELEEPAAVFDENGNQLTSVDEAPIMVNDSVTYVQYLADTVSKRWITSLFTLAGSNMFTACRLDDVMILYADGTYQYSAGSNLCGAEDNQSSRVGNWEVDMENDRIIFDRRTSNEYVANIIGLNENELRVSGLYRGMEVRGLYSKN